MQGGRPHRTSATIYRIAGRHHPIAERNHFIAGKPTRGNCRSSRNQNQVQRIHRARETCCRQNAPTGEHPYQRTLQLCRIARNIHRRTTKATAYRSGNFGTGKSYSRCLSVWHKRLVGPARQIEFGEQQTRLKPTLFHVKQTDKNQYNYIDKTL